MSLATNRFAAERQAWMQRLLPDGVPTLWCPLLTHYTDDGALDKPRMRAQLDFLQSSVKGFLIPGSTGDAWELSDAETRELLEFAVRGVGRAPLRPADRRAEADHRRDAGATSRPRRPGCGGAAGADDTTEALRRASVCGFTVCPPRGAGLSQQQIRDDARPHARDRPAGSRSTSCRRSPATRWRPRRWPGSPRATPTCCC